MPSSTLGVVLLPTEADAGFAYAPDQILFQTARPCMRQKRTQSVQDGIPTQSVGNESAPEARA